MKQREWLFGNIVIVDFEKIDSCYRLPISIMDEYLLKRIFYFIYHFSSLEIQNSRS